jgi:His/Glu/Gln/Arg/opine family amino acid ABC transporter permease subunit
MLRYEFDWSVLARSQFFELLGTLIAVARLSTSAHVRVPANAAIEMVRNIPGLFWILFFYFVLPELLPASLGRSLHEWPGYAFVAGVLGLTVDNSAYLSDIVRNGMAKVCKGQRDAAASCGMTVWQECLWILCPQSLRAMMPAIANRMVHNFKNTSLCVAIALPELTWAAQQIESLTFKGLEVTAAATVIYSLGSLTIAFALSRVFRARPALVERSNGEQGSANARR